MSKRVRLIALSSTFSVSFVRSLSTLKNPAFQSLLFDRTQAVEEPRFVVRNPADPSQVVGTAPIHEVSHVRKAIQASQEALPQWRDHTTAATRSKLLSQWSKLINENVKDLAILMTLESGKPLPESLGEVAYASSFLDYYAAESVRPTSAGGGFITPTPFADASGKPQGQVISLQQAIGVTASITPWNFPLAMITRKAGPALAVGCTTLIKPSELTPLSALALQHLAREAGIPPAVLQVVTTDTETTPLVGRELCRNPAVRKLSFTGSTHVGKVLMKQSADTVQKLSLELGGNAPFVVFEDADLDIAVQAAMASKFRHAGQTCVCADRFLVHHAVHDEFVRRFCEQVQNIHVGPGMAESVTMGPLITSDAVDKMEYRVNEAIDEGAMCVSGGRRLNEMGPHFYEPSVLTDVATTSQIWSQETFGPVAAIRSFGSDQEALELSNDSTAGLAAYFCTNDLSRVFRFSNALESGMVGVNAGIISNCVAPFGGVKESGLGREGSALGISEYLETKYIYMST